MLYALTAVAQRRWLNDSADSDASLARLDVVVFVIATLLLFALFAALLRRFKSEPPSRDARILAIVFPVAFNVLLVFVPPSTSICCCSLVSLGSRLAAPLDLLFVDGAIGRRVYFTATWVLAIGLPLIVAVLVHLRRSTRLAVGSSTA